MATVVVEPVICCKKLEKDFFRVNLLRKYPETRFLFAILMRERIGHIETILEFRSLEHTLGRYALAFSMVLLWKSMKNPNSLH